MYREFMVTFLFFPILQCETARKGNGAHINRCQNKEYYGNNEYNLAVREILKDSHDTKKE